MIHQMNIYGKDMVDQAIERIKTFEPPDGYYLAFSGGKDSVVIKALAEMAGVKFDAHYNLTSVDPPELVQFIKKYHPDVSIDKPRYEDGTQVTMWNLIPKRKMPPTRMVRYCCKALKEVQGENRFVITGVRRAESSKRSTRGGVEFSDYKTKRLEQLDPDNPDQEMVHNCLQKRRRILNPIIDWSTDDVWEFIREYNVPYCSLYDEGFTRLGCIGCPMAGTEGRLKEFARWPKYKELYIHAFDRMIKARQAGTAVDPVEEMPDDSEIWHTAAELDSLIEGRKIGGADLQMVDTLSGKQAKSASNGASIVKWTDPMKWWEWYLYGGKTGSTK